MKWVTNFYFAEGPGIAKDAPKKRGLALIADTVWREGFELMKLNLMFALFALPLITLPAAIAALMDVTLVMAQDRNVYLWDDFKSAFKRHAVRASVAGPVIVATVGVPATAAYVYGSLALANAYYVPAFVLAVGVTFLLAIAGVYFMAFLVSSEAPLFVLVRFALNSALARPLPVLAALGFVAALWLLHILFYPVSILMPALINFSFGALVIAFSVLELVKRVYPRREGAEGRRV